MRFTVKGEVHEFDENSITFAEARALEKVTGLTMATIGAAAKGGSVTVVQALVWIACKRSATTLTFSDIDDWPISSVEIASDEPDADEAEPDPTEVAASE